MDLREFEDKILTAINTTFDCDAVLIERVVSKNINIKFYTDKIVDKIIHPTSRKDMIELLSSSDITFDESSDIFKNILIMIGDKNYTVNLDTTYLYDSGKTFFDINLVSVSISKKDKSSFTANK